MKMSVQISEKDFEKYGFQSADLSWEELVRKVKSELAKEALEKCKLIAVQVGLSEMSMADIDAEIKAVRDAEGHS